LIIYCEALLVVLPESTVQGIKHIDCA